MPRNGDLNYSEWLADMWHRYGDSLLMDGYKVRPLTCADIDRAAELVAHIGTTTPMKSGSVGFDHGLRGGYWFTEVPLGAIEVRMPAEFDLESCRRAVLEGLDACGLDLVESIAEDQHPLDAARLRLELRALEVE
jgi:hypothetical protein